MEEDTQNQNLHTIPIEIYGTWGQSNETKFDLLLLALYNLNESRHQLLINWYILYYAQETKMTWHCGYQNCTTMHFHTALKYWMQYEIQMGCSDWPQVLASKFLPFFDFKKIWHLHLKEIYLFIQRWEYCVWNWQDTAAKIW